MQAQLPTYPVRRRPRIRLSIRTVMAIVLVTGVGLAWIVLDGRQVQAQREAVRAIENAGGSVSYDWEWTNGNFILNARPPRPGWIARVLGADTQETAVTIYLPDECKSDELLVHVGQLRGLEEIDLSRMRGTDAGLAHLHGLKKLRVLDLSETTVGDAGLAHLSRLTNLRELNLSETDVTDAGLVHMEGMAGLQILDLSHTAVGDAGLAHLRSLTNLRELWLNDTDVTDAGLAHLKGLTKLRSVDLMSTRVSHFGAEELRRSLRKAKIIIFDSIL
jgi:internalin A